MLRQDEHEVSTGGEDEGSGDTGVVDLTTNLPETSPESAQPKIGIVVVAYNAASTLEQVLDRIPVEFRSRISRVYVCDDHSDDQTYAIGMRIREVMADLDVYVVRWHRNLGYGGNQKASYELAIGDGMDIVVLLHGDGQYAPEALEDIVTPIVEGSADAVFGSRMMTPGEARRGGMPLYKYVGNRILTRFENAMLRTDLSEFHSGYRAYRTDVLGEIGYGDLSDDFDFDTEIIVRLVDRSKRIVEVPIPTYYGDEICRVDGIKYAAQVSTDVVTWRLNRMGLGRGRLGTPADVYPLKADPESSHGKLLAELANLPAGTVLDLGSSSGEFTRQVAAMGHRVTGVDLVHSDEIDAICERFVVADLDDGIPAELDGTTYDIVILADVLEHLKDPRQLLEAAMTHLAPGGQVLVSVPNVSHWYPRVRIGLGLFDYDKRGILDVTHLRFFTKRSFERLLLSTGLAVNSWSYTASPASAPMANGAIGRRLRALALRLRPTLFAYQLVARAEIAKPIGYTANTALDS